MYARLSVNFCTLIAKTFVFISHSENSLYLFYPQSLINIKTL